MMEEEFRSRRSKSERCGRSRGESVFYLLLKVREVNGVFLSSNLARSCDDFINIITKNSLIKNSP